MNQKEALQKLLEDKIKRQTELNIIHQQLDELDLDLFGSRMGRWFGSTYLVLKQITSLILGFLFVFTSLFIIFYPDVLMEVEVFRYMGKISSLRIIFVSSGILLMLGFVLLYISRLSSKMRKRNHQISDAQKLTQEIIQHYKRYVKETEDEIEKVRVIIRMESSHFNS